MTNAATSGQAADAIPLATLAQNKELVVFDYDGTLADLGVDWDAVRQSLHHAAKQFGFDSSFRPLWVEMARARDAAGPEAVKTLFQALAKHERAAVATQKPRTQIVDQATALLNSGNRPECGVFSVNLHETVAAGLENLRLGALGHIVGADDVSHWKPDPEGLHILMNTCSCSPKDTLFIGDSTGDQAAAQAAGVEFLWA